LHRRELPLSILQSKLAASLHFRSLPGEDLAPGMAMFFEIPLIDDFLDPSAYGLILDAIGTRLCPCVTSFVLNRRRLETSWED